MSFRIDDHNPIIIKIREFNNSDSGLDRSKIKDLSKKILVDQGFKKGNDLQSVVSLITNPSDRQRVCHRLATKLHSSDKSQAFEDEISDLEKEYGLICEGMNQEQKLEFCLMVPKKNWIDILTLLKLGYPEERRRNVENFAKFPPETLANFALFLPNHLSDLINEEVIKKLIETFKSRSLEELKDTVALIELYGEKLDQWTISSKLDEFANLPPETLRILAHNLPKFVDDTTSRRDLDSMMEVIAKFPPEVNFSDIDLILNVYHPKLNLNSKIYEMKYSLSRLPPEILTNLVLYLPQLVNPERNSNQINSVIKIFKEFPKVNWSKETELLLTFKESGFEIIDLMRELPFIPEKDRKEILESFLPVHTLLTSSDDPLFIFYLLPESLRTQEKLQGDLWKNQEYREGIIKSAEDKLTQSQLPPETLQKVADFVSAHQKKLNLSEHHPCMVLANFIRRCFEINPKNPMEMIAAAKSLINPQMTNYDVMEILHVINKLPEKNRERIIFDAKKLFDPTMNWVDQIMVIYIVAKTRPELREQQLRQLDLNTPWRSKLDTFLSLEEMTTTVKNNPLSKWEDTETDDLLFKDISLDDYFSDVPSNSLFAKTDLIVCKDNFQGVLPLNGIKASELREVEALAHQIFSGNGKITIDTTDEKFQKEVQNHILTLLTRSIGRKIIRKTLNNPSISTLKIIKNKSVEFSKDGGNTFGCNTTKPEETFIILSPIEKESLFETKDKLQSQYVTPIFIILGHELIHATHYQGQGALKHPLPNLGIEYTDLEEQITITGHKKSITLPEQLSSQEWEDEEAELYGEESFDSLNERNLAAAFANTNRLFFPRSSHKGDERSPPNTPSFVQARITENLTKQRLQAPLSLKRTYADLIKDLPSWLK